MTQRGFTSLLMPLGTGLLLGLLCLAAGQLVLGMGHGWDLPRAFGALSLLFYPLAMIRWQWLDRRASWQQDASTMALVAAPLFLVLVLSGVLPNPVGFQIEGWVIVLGALSAYALACAAMRRSRAYVLVGDAALLLLGLLLDFVAASDFLASSEASGSALLALPWILLWLGWQVIAAAALRHHGQ